MKTESAFIAIGSNLQNPLQQVKISIVQIQQLPHTHLKKVSSNYLTSPLGPQNQPDFINCVVEISTQLDSEQLLDHLQGIEKLHGRVRNFKWGPRTLDLDILIYGNQVIQTERLIIPHPGLKERVFFIDPLFEIAPKWILPDGEIIADLKKNRVAADGSIRQLIPGEDPYAQNSGFSGQL